MVRDLTRSKSTLALGWVALAGLGACHAEEGGGGQTQELRASPNAADIALPAGYRIELVAAGLTFPTGVAVDEAGRIFVVEAGYSYGEVFTRPRLLEVATDGSVTELATGEHPPWTGVAHHDGVLYVAEGGELGGGRILRVAPGESPVALVSSLPSTGDHHTNGPAFDEQGALYFAVGTATNSGIVGEDNFEFGWLERHPDFHDVPCEDLTLSGQNFESGDPRTPDDPSDRVKTGAYVPFGTETSPGQVVAGKIPCSGAIFKLTSEQVKAMASGAATTPELELVAWGFRNPFGLAFHGGELYVTENGYDERGSRPVFGTGDVLWRVTKGAWYGWPDHSAGRSLSDARFAGSSPAPAPLLLDRPQPPAPLAHLAVHSSSNGLDLSRSPDFGHVGHAFIAQLGDMAPGVGSTHGAAGFKVVRVDPSTGVVEDFAVNRGERNGPGSLLGKGGLERPVAARFDPSGTALYIVDFGVIRTSEQGPISEQGTGMLWKITRGEP